MRKNPERTAWIVLIISFFIFCLLTVSIPLGIRAYLLNATTSFTTTLTSIRGTVLAKPYRQDQSLPLTRGNTMSADELTVVSTDDTSQAGMTLFEGSEITLYNNTTLIIHKTREPRFDLSPNPAQVELEVVKGRIRISASSYPTNRLFSVRTPQARSIFLPGSYAVEVTDQQTRLTARSGEAHVTAQGATVVVSESELSTIVTGSAPTPAIAAEQNLLVNGDFKAGLSNSWNSQIYVPSETITDAVQSLTYTGDNMLTKFDIPNAVTSTLQVIELDGEWVLRFNTKGRNNVHTEASVEQTINKDVQDFRSLRINAQIRLDYQSLPGGGQLGTEFPVMIQLNYRDIEGNDRAWYRGFYYDPPPGNYSLHNDPSNASESITQFLWYPYESENLLENLGKFEPAYIKSIRIYASGWIYDAMITDVKLLAED